MVTGNTKLTKEDMMREDRILAHLDSKVLGANASRCDSYEPSHQYLQGEEDQSKVPKASSNFEKKFSGGTVVEKRSNIWTSIE